MSVDMKSMIDAGVHFGHRVQKWNPKMRPFIFGRRGGIHIIDLQKTVEATQAALKFVQEMAAKGQRMIFVGTKRQAVEATQEAALKCQQFYVTKRWLGGTLTNFQTIKASIDRLRKLEIIKEKGEFQFLNKREQARMEKEYERLRDGLAGIRDMKELPGMMFVVDLRKERIAVLEARCLRLPIISLADTNTDPGVADYPIPGNDDAIRSIRLFTDLVAEAYLKGSKEFHIRKQMEVDKEDQAAVQPRKSSSKKEEGEGSGEGPVVMKKARRKLVAAGTADDVEIEMEVAQESVGESNSSTELQAKAKDVKESKEASTISQKSEKEKA